MKMTISMVAAAGADNSLGKEGKLLWHLPHDLRRFKKLTYGHPVIMGRKTFETLPHPLPGRTNIIVTRNTDYKAEGCVVVHTIEEALEKAKEVQKNNEICIVGGGEIYTLGMPFANKIELTRVHGNFTGADAFFPQLNPADWELQSDIFHSEDKKHPYSFTYYTFVRK